MSRKFDCEEEPNEFMEAPCRCDCGKFFDLEDGYSSENSNAVICRECHKEEQNQIEIQEALEEIENAECEIDDATSRITQAKRKLEKLGYQK